MNCDKFNNKILLLKNYDYTEIKANDKIYLDLNENMFINHHKSLFSSINNQLKYLYLYPRNKNTNNQLYDSIAEYCNINKNNIYVTSGSDNALKYIFNTFCLKDTKTLILTPTYEMIYNFIQLTDTEIINLDICLKENEISESEEVLKILKNGLLEYNPNIVYLCNPNNPLSYFFSNINIKELLEEFKNTIFIIDEAYIEFINDYKINSSINLINNYENLIITRTFSKGFGLASLRIGYMISNYKNIEIIRKQGNNKDVLDISKLAAISILENLDYYNFQFEKILKLNYKICNKILEIINLYPNGDIYKCIGKINSGYITLLCKTPKQLIEFIENNYHIVIRNKSHNNIGIVRISMCKKDIMEKVVNACKEYQLLTSKISNS